MCTGPEPVLDLFLCYVCAGALCLAQNTLRKHLHVIDFVIISYVGVGKNLSVML